ncbi:hypothetical protein BGX26_002543 [Mortierella sp. AD094]|nr:hypothetical protein BGX26_002543 [Mortierella sp. AD094]
MVPSWRSQNMREEKPSPPSQVFRPIYKDVVSGHVTPFSNTIMIEPRYDSKKGEYFILWNDIKAALPNPLHVWRGHIAVPFHLNDDFEFAQPLRFSTYPGIVLDVIVETPVMGAAAESIRSQNPPSYTSTSPKKHNIGSTSGPPSLTKENNDTQNPMAAKTSQDLNESQEITTSSTLESIGRTPHLFPDSNDESRNSSNHVKPDTEHQCDGSISVAPHDEEAIDEDYVRGVAYLEGWNIRQDYVKALDFFFKAAHRGHGPAQCRIWNIKGSRQGVEADYSKIVERYLVEAKQGNADAQFNMGFVYEMGYGVVKNYSKSMEWYQKAADQGHAYAQCIVGSMHLKGYGVTQSYFEALEWYQKAADQGNPTAQCGIGNIYDFAYGVPQDLLKAFEWYQKSANQGYINAQFNVGNMYSDGRGVTQDKCKAVEWWKKAASRGHVSAGRKIVGH